MAGVTRTLFRTPSSDDLADPEFKHGFRACDGGRRSIWRRWV